jgi:hypothetical protein
MAFVILVCVLAIAFTALSLGANPHGVPDTPENESSYESAACAAAENGRQLPPLQFDDGGSMVVACDVAAA